MTVEAPEQRSPVDSLCEGLSGDIRKAFATFRSSSDAADEDLEAHRSHIIAGAIVGCMQRIRSLPMPQADRVKAHEQLWSNAQKEYQNCCGRLAYFSMRAFFEVIVPEVTAALAQTTNHSNNVVLELTEAGRLAALSQTSPASPLGHIETENKPDPDSPQG